MQRELGLSKQPAALALPASASQVKGHQASALRIPAFKTSPFTPPPAPLAQSLPEHFALVGEFPEKQPGDNKGQREEGQEGLARLGK